MVIYFLLSPRPPAFAGHASPPGRGGIEEQVYESYLEQVMKGVKS